MSTGLFIAITSFVFARLLKLWLYGLFNILQYPVSADFPCLSLRTLQYVCARVCLCHLSLVHPLDAGVGSVGVARLHRVVGAEAQHGAGVAA